MMKANVLVNKNGDCTNAILSSLIYKQFRYCTVTWGKDLDQEHIRHDV